jgi:hypothetical protein
MVRVPFPCRHSITNNIVFSAEDAVGNVLTNNDNNRVIALTLQFYQIQYPIIKIGPASIMIFTSFERKLHDELWSSSMKIFKKKSRKAAGYALLVVFVFAAISLMTLGGALLGPQPQPAIPPAITNISIPPPPRKPPLKR